MLDSIGYTEKQQDFSYHALCCSTCQILEGNSTLYETVNDEIVYSP